MAFDYVLEFPCEVRKVVPEAKLVALVGYRSLVEFAVAEIRRQIPDASMEAILGYTVQASQSRPDGTTTQVPMTIGELIALAKPIDQHKAHCQKCPANIAARPFGCIAKINYPLRKESEEWLLSRLTGDMTDPNLMLLFRFLSEIEVDGRPSDTMRARLFELQNPVVRRWGLPPSQNQVTSSQIIQLLLFASHIAPQQAALYTKLLGLNSVLSDPHPPSGNIEQFKTLMCAFVMAGRLNAMIRVEA